MSVITIGRASGKQTLAEIDSVPRKQVSSMSELNLLVEQAWHQRVQGQPSLDPSFMHDSIWEQWLWLEDPMEESHIDLLLNRMQLLGLLIAR